MTKNSSRWDSSGFTIIELLIATLVFSTILIILSVGLIQIARVYYKGITTTRTQQTARDITDNITRSIQFNGGTITPLTGPDGQGRYYFCVNNDRYTFQKNKQLVDGTPNSSQANHVLVKDTVAACSGPASLTNLGGLTNAVELMGPRMRLADLQLTNVGGTKLYTLLVRVVAGEDDLLDLSNLAQAKCISVQTGTQFCATAQLQSTVQKRI